MDEGGGVAEPASPAGADLVVLTGPPGAGKSTIGPLLADLFDPSALITGDDFFAYLRRGFIEPWRAESARQNTTVTAAGASAAGTMVAGGITVVFDGMVGPWLLPTFTRAAALPRLHYAVLLPPVDICVEQALTRTGNDFRNVEVVRHMHREFTASGIDPRHLIDNAAEPAETTARKIAERVRDGSLLFET